ncbi:MAG TPA: Crp/Fnr family transcriptional regulator [Pyrinomonadaceae bacterium]|nr:Crp/Fnr family transcriptional regulator [Pyrinomonadaceae bacterium]
MQVLNRINIQNKCSDCKFRENNFFCNLREENLRIFESFKITNAYPKGSTLFMQGQNSNGVYILCQGRVKLSTCSKDGKVIILHIAEPGEVLGLSSAVSNSVHLSTAEVLEPCQVNFVKNQDFLAFIRQNPEACLSAVKQLGLNYQTAYFQICSLGLSNSVADRLASLFLTWCKEFCDEHESIHLKISYTHEEIAQMIGTSRETVTRLLKDFKNRKLISLKGSDLVIHNKRVLESVVWS